MAMKGTILHAHVVSKGMEITPDNSTFWTWELGCNNRFCCKNTFSMLASASQCPGPFTYLEQSIRAKWNMYIYMHNIAKSPLAASPLLISK